MDRVLIVEDTDENIEILKATLGDKYGLSVAKNGKIALDIIGKVKPDLILLDVMMPIMDGYETIRRLKKSEEYKEIPVIFLSAQKSLEEKMKGFQLGAVDYITKPFFAKEVVTRIDAHLALKHAKQEVKDVLSKTVIGATRTILEMFATLEPDAYKMSNEVKSLTSALVEIMELENGWTIEIAAMFSMVGTFTIPNNAVNALLKGKDNIVDSKYRNAYYQRHVIGHRLLVKIPRYTDIAEMIRKQDEDLGMIAFDPKNIPLVGAQIIYVATAYNLMVLRGQERKNIILYMRRRRKEFPISVVEKLEQALYLLDRKRYLRIKFEQLEVGMKLFAPIINREQQTILEAGTIVDEIMMKNLILIFKYEMDDQHVIIDTSKE